MFESTFAIQEMRDIKHEIYRLSWWDISFKNRTGTALRNPVKSSQSKINVLMEVFIQKLSGIKVFLLILYLINMSGEKNRSRLNTPLLPFHLEHVSVARCVWKVEKKESLSFKEIVWHWGKHHAYIRFLTVDYNTFIVLAYLLQLMY